MTEATIDELKQARYMSLTSPPASPEAKRLVDSIIDIIDRIGGWSASSIGASYGKGYELPVPTEWMKMLED
jgi:hypothetical protein